MVHQSSLKIFYKDKENFNNINVKIKIFKMPIKNIDVLFYSVGKIKIAYFPIKNHCLIFTEKKDATEVIK